MSNLVNPYMANGIYNQPMMPNQFQMQPQMQPQMQSQMQSQQSQIQPRSSRIWAQGETGAKAYLVAPNTSVDIWDSENKTIYVKTADINGMPSMQILDYTIRGEGAEVPSSVPQNELEKVEVNYVSLDEFNALKQEINAIKERLKNTPQQKRQTSVKKGGNL